MSMGSLGGSSFVVTADTRPFEAGMRRAQVDAKRTHQVLDAELGRSAENLGKKFSELGKRSGHVGLGLLQISNMVDDVQYGFRGMVNNVAPAIMMFGGSGGLAAGATIAAVAVNQLVQHWDTLMDSMRAGWLNVPAAELEKVRVRAEEAGEAFDKLTKTPSKVQAAQIDAIEKAMIEADRGGPAMVVKGVAEAISTHPLHRGKLTDDQEKQRAFMEAELKKPLPARAVDRALAVQIREGYKKILIELGEQLKKANAEAARQLIGRALLPGEKGDSARATLQRLLHEFPNSFTAKFKRMMMEATDEAAENAEANRAAVRHLGVSPLMRQLMMGRFGDGEPEGPVDAKGAAGAMRKHPVLGRLTRKARDAFAGQMAGMTADQMHDVLGGVTPKAMEEFRKKFPAIPRDNVLANMIPDMIRDAKAKPPKPKDDPLAAAVDARLKAAGAQPGEPVGDPKAIARGMREQMAAQVRSIMLEQGVDRRTAEAMLLRQSAQQHVPGFNRPAQWIGGADAARMSATAALSGGRVLPDLAKQQLKELMDINRALTAMAKKPAAPAQAGK